MKDRSVKALTRYLVEASEDYPEFCGIFSLYSDLIQICSAVELDDLHPFLKEKPWTDEKVPILNRQALDPSVLVHTQETYIRIQKTIEQQKIPLGGVSLAFCLKWALKPALTNLRESIADQIFVPVRPLAVCPLCGGSPSMAEIPSQDLRLLCCGFCGYRWIFPPEVCLSCGNRDHEKMAFFMTDDRNRRGYRAETCEICKKYIKTAYRKVQMGYPDDADVEDVITLPLDALASHRGYRMFD